MFLSSDPPTPPASSEEIVYGQKFNFVESQKALSEYSGRVLEAFTQTRERIFEIQTAIIDSVPAITRLGGKIQDVSKIISEVAIASRRNVVASQEDIEGLFTLTKVLGLSATELTNAFLDVGRGIETIPEELGKSIKFIQNIGGNARTIMADVNKNMGQMNRFQFNEGVQGLTKMAAQASMLRFDMSKTFTFAENLYKPEEAIKVAAAFQRMGVAIGGLGDPLQLMNQSINDPSGLQDSLVKVSKQFTFLDKQTNSFKISRQGVLILKELGEQAGIDSQEMMKMGLAAAELDRRLSAINDAGLTIASEEDKQYLANIAKMEGGTYKVKIDENTTKELSQLNQTEFDKLIEQQKNAPKTLEDTARASLRLDQIMAMDVQAIRNSVVGGVLGSGLFQSLNEDIRNVTETLTRGISKAFKPEDVRGDMNDIFGTIGEDITKILSKGITDPEKIFETLLEGKEEKLTEVGQKKIGEILEGSKGMLNELATKYKESNINQFFSGANPVSTMTAAATGPITTTGLSVGGTEESSSTPMSTLPTRSRSTEVIFDGDVGINVNFSNLPEGLTSLQRAEVIKTVTDEFKRLSYENFIKNLVNPRSSINTQ